MNELVYTEEEISLLAYWNVIWKNKWLIVLIVLCSVIVTYFVIKETPKTYLANASLLPMDDQSSSLSAALGSLPLTGGSLKGSSSDKLLIILNSRTIAEMVVQKLELVEPILKEQKNKFNISKLIRFFLPTRKESNNTNSIIDLEQQKIDISTIYLKQKISTYGNKEGLINISAEWTHPVTSSDIVSSYISALSTFLNDNSINITFSVIDQVHPPTSIYRPKLLTNLFLAFLISFVCAIFSVFVKEALCHTIQQQKHNNN